MASKSVRSPKKKTTQPKTHGTRSAPRRTRSAKHEHSLDACDLKLEMFEVTPDEDLPAAEGGVA